MKRLIYEFAMKHWAISIVEGFIFKAIWITMECVENDALHCIFRYSKESNYVYTMYTYMHRENIKHKRTIVFIRNGMYVQHIM